jgi:hypothetical protein
LKFLRIASYIPVVLWRLQLFWAELRGASSRDVAKGAAILIFAVAVCAGVLWWSLVLRFPFCLNPDSAAGTMCLDPHLAVFGTPTGTGK